MGVMKTSIFITIVFAGLIAAGCRTTTYLSLTENNKEQVEQKLNDYEQNEDVGAEVILSVKNGEKISGELLSVRESSLIICKEHYATEVELANLKYPINTVKNDEIKELTIEGSNYIWLGLGIGIAAGFGLGVLVGISSFESGSFQQEAYTTYAGGGIGLLAGAVVGLIVGYFNSTEEVILQEVPPDYNWSILKTLARYPDEEPEYLQAIE